MAKKVVAPPENEEDGDGKKRKKKRSVCCTCCLTLLVVCFVLNAAILGVGWYFGDKYSREYFNMSLGQVFGVVNGLYWTNDKDVVDNPYNDSDLDGFYTEIKATALLKSDAEVDFDAALDLAVEKFLAGDGSSGTVTALRRTSDGETGDTAGGSGDTDIMNILLDMVKDAFTRDNIDVDKLAAYSETNDDYFFDLKDKQLAAFVQKVIDVVLKNADKIDALSQFAGIVDFDKVAALKQISFKTVSEKNALGEEVKTATTADVTVWLGLQSAAGQALTYYIDDAGYSWATGLARGLANMLLPKNLYVTLTVPLQGEADVQVTLNDMSAEKRDRLYTLINGVMNLGGGGGEEQTVQDMLNSIAEPLKPYLDMLADAGDDVFGTAGELKLDLIDMMAKTASESISPDDPLTKSDFMFTLQAVLTSSAENRRAELKPYLYEGWYEKADGTLVFDPADKTGLTAVNYETKFIEEIETKYSLDFGENKTIDSVLETLGISVDGSSSPDVDVILDKISKQRFKASLDVADIRSLDLNITDRMLAAALSGQLDKMLGDMGDMQVTLDALTFVEYAARPDHLYALVAVTADISGMLDSLGGDNPLIALATNVLPEKLMLTVTVDITQSLPAGDEYTPVSFLLNDYQNTDRVLDTLAKLAPELDLKSMTGEIEQTLRDLVKQLDDTLGITLTPSATLQGETSSGSIVLPNIFQVVTDMALKDDDGVPVVTATELQSVLRGLSDTDGFDPDGNIADNYNGFITDVVDMYYLNVDPEAITDFAQLADSISGGDGFASEKFRIGTEGDLDQNRAYMIYDARAASELAPVMSAAELGALIAENFQTSDGEQTYTVNSVKTGDNSLTIVLAIDVGSMLPAEVGKLMDLDTLYATAEVDLSHAIDVADGKAYPVDIALNNMTTEQFDATMKLVKHFAGDSMDIESQTADIGKILYEQLGSLNSGFGGEGFFKFTSRGLELKGFYDFLATQLDELEGCDPDDVKAAIQGMYEHNADMLNPANYDTDDFIVNPSNVENFDIPTNGGSVTDNEFNGYFQAIMAKSGMSSVKVEQTIVIAKGADTQKAEAARAWVNDHSATQITDGGEYIVVTFKLNVSKSGDSTPAEGDGASSSIDGFLPGAIHATVVLEKVDGKFVESGIIFNNMDADAYAVILKIMGLEQVEGETTDDGKININSIVKECVENLNGLGQLGDIKLLPHEDPDDTVVGKVQLPSIVG